MNSSTPFLKQLAVKCFEQYGNQSDKLTLVFPNKRAGLFFRKYLSELTSKPIWSPIILSIEEFVMSFSGKQPADQNRLLFALYAIYKSKIKKAESFENFYHWGEMILNDFNDIDNNLIDPEHIFRIVKSQKELDDAFYYLSDDDQKTIQSFWASFLPKPTKTQSDFLRTWEVLNVLYQDFNQLLSEKNTSYKGRLYRELSESIKDESIEISQKPLWFAGFNALTKTEETIIKYFVEDKKAEIFWDLDNYYLKNEIQESGFFYRAYLDDNIFGESIKRDAIDAIQEEPKEISIHSVALSIGQVKAVGEQLAELSVKEGFSAEKTVVVLPDENLLLPMLNSIPESIQQVNVTMGYPIKNSNYYTFLENLLELIAFSMQGKENHYFKSKSILSLLNHSVYKSIFKQTNTSFTKEIIAKNRNLIHLDEIKTELPSLYVFIENSKSSDVFLESLSALLHDIPEDDLTTLDKAIIYELNKILVNIEQSTLEFDLQMDIKSLARLFTRLGSTKVPFSGEPLLGLQIMGTMETRNLDFEHVFILDMNESIWPKNTSNSSFIPYNIRKAFDLPVVEHQDAIQAYQFYRLLHHAKTVNIYYNNVSEFNHSGELSRYVQQLQLESGLNIKQYSISNSIAPRSIKPIEIVKDEKILKELSKYYSNHENSKRLSPSAINTYLDCKLKFYFKYIEKVKEKEELNEVLDPAAFGNLLHLTMEYFYQDIMDRKGSKFIEKSDLNSISDLLKLTIERAFKDENRKIDEDDIHNGQQLIASRVIEKFASQIIKHDEAYAPFEIQGLEVGQDEGYVLDLPIKIGDELQPIGLKGVIDRIDKKGKVIRILDYKSGGDERKFSTIESLFDREHFNRNKAAMQVLLYCLFYKQNNSGSDDVLVPGVFNSKDLFSPEFDVKIKEGRSNVVTNFTQVEQEYKEELENLLSDIFDPIASFDQTEDYKKCDYCPYSEICMRN